MCDKITYNSFYEAQKVVNHALSIKVTRDGKRVKHRNPKKPKRVYKCESCGKFHLTSQKKYKFKDYGDQQY